MQRILSILYLILAIIFAFGTTVLEIQPAIFLIDFIAPNPGDRYSVSTVSLLILLISLIPLIILLLIAKMFRAKPSEVVNSERTGVFVTREKAFQSALVGIPIYINSKKVGIVDSGKTKFFDVPRGVFTIQAGKGKQASQILEVQLTNKNQLNFFFVLGQTGLFTKIELSEIH